MQNKHNWWEDTISTIIPRGKLALRLAPAEMRKVLSLLPFLGGDLKNLLKRFCICFIYCIFVNIVIIVSLTFLQTYTIYYSFLIPISISLLLSLIVLSFFLALIGEPNPEMIKDMKHVKALIREVQNDFNDLENKRKMFTIVSKDIVEFDAKHPEYNNNPNSKWGFSANKPMNNLHIYYVSLKHQLDTIQASIVFIESHTESTLCDIEDILSKYVSRFDVPHKTRTIIQIYPYISSANFISDLFLQGEIENAKEARDHYIYKAPGQY